jgi:hypothetical protein
MAPLRTDRPCSPSGASRSAAGDRAALGLVGTSQEGEYALVNAPEHRHRWDVAAAFENLGQGKVVDDSPRPRQDRPGGEERVLLGGEHRHRTTEASELLLGGHPGEVGVQPEMPEGRPELPDGGAEGGVLGLREQKPSRAPETLLGGTESVEEHRETDLEEHPQKGACGYACGGDERRLRDALGGYSHGPDRYGRPVGEAHQRRPLEAQAVEDVLRPESVPVPLRRGPLLRAKAGLPYDVGCVEAVALGQGQEPLEAGGVQGVASRQEDDGRCALGAEGEDVRVAEARPNGQALVAETQPGERLLVERPELGLALGRFVDGLGRGYLQREKPTRPVSVAGSLKRVQPGSRLSLCVQGPFCELLRLEMALSEAHVCRPSEGMLRKTSEVLLRNAWQTSSR